MTVGTVQQGSLLVAVILSAMPAVTGCRRSLEADVSGQVTLDGTSLATGLVTFFPVAGPVAYGAIDGNGRYVMQTGGTGGLQPGEYVVTVAANASPSSSSPQVGNHRYAEPIMPLITPLRYAKKDRTPLRASVKPGSQTIDFALESQ